MEFILASTAETEQILEFAQQLQQKAMQSGMFAFPPIIDVKIDQPQSEFVIDRDKVADLGLNLEQVGADLGAMVGGNFVNRFDIAGRSYKVIPQIAADRPAQPGPAAKTSTSPGRTANWCRSPPWPPSRTPRCPAP